MASTGQARSRTSKGWLRRIAASLLGRPRARAGPRAEVRFERGPGPLTHGEIVGTLRRVVVQNSDGARSPEDVGAGDHLYERGHVDSVGGLALLTFIEDHYGLAIDEAELVTRLHTLDALAGHILASAPPARG